MKIVTNFVYPPIPVRQFDWSAVDDETYDGEGCKIGYGATEQEAIDDLLDQMNDGCLTDTEQKAQAARCACRGSDDYCVCQNAPDLDTKAERRASSVSSKDSQA